MNVFITGASGFIGFHRAKGLVKNGHKVRGLVRPQRDAMTLDWGTRKQFEIIMVDGTRNLLKGACGNVSRFVYGSSIAALGFGKDLTGLDKTAQRKDCGGPYCDTQIVSEDLVADFCAENRLDYTVVKPSNVIGPDSVSGKEIVFHNPGTNFLFGLRFKAEGRKKVKELNPASNIG